MLRATYHPNVLAIRALEKPVIAAVNGPCAGAGLSLACACDLRIAAESASFVPGFVGIGLVPDAGGSFHIARLLGQARAFEWMTSNRKLSAEQAARLGARLRRSSRTPISRPTRPSWQRTTPRRRRRRSR